MPWTLSSQWQWCLSLCLVLSYSFWGAQSQKAQQLGLGTHGEWMVSPKTLLSEAEQPGVHVHN